MQLLQSDIFESDFSKKDTLVVVFGHIGFNEMSTSWKKYSSFHPELTGIKNPFSQFKNRPINLVEQCWFWFVPESENHGITTAELENILNNIFAWVKDNAISSIITNGVSNVDHSIDTESNRMSDNERACYLIEYMSKIERNEDCKVTLISRNDVFTRNRP